MILKNEEMKEKSMSPVKKIVSQILIKTIQLLMYHKTQEIVTTIVHFKNMINYLMTP